MPCATNQHNKNHQVENPITTQFLLKNHKNRLKDEEKIKV